MATAEAATAGPPLYEADVVAYSPGWRVAAGTLRCFSRGCLLAFVAALFLSDMPPTNPLKQMRLFAGLFLAPEIAAWCVARAFTMRMRVDDGTLRLVHGDELVEVPLSSVASVSPWRVPIPGSGLWLTLRSGRRFPRALQVSDPVAVVDAMVAAGAAHELRGPLHDAMVVYARARLAHPHGRLENPLLKFVLFSLVPTIPIFRLHQYITYGGTLGEYYTFGLAAYVLAFAIWWASWTINLVLLASVLRAIVEVVSLAAAAAVPNGAGRVRQVMEIVQRVVYYIGMPLWIVLRLTA